MEKIKERWVPSVLIPLFVIAVVVGLITGIGELLLWLQRLDGDYTSVGGALLILVIITIVAVIFGLRMGKSSA